MPDAQPLEPTDPARLGPYRLTGRIGSGGQGVVYLGEAEDGSAVAIKLFHASLGADRTLRDAFTRELEAAKRVARFCIAQVLDSGMVGDRPYIVSEYVPGPSLHAVVAEEGPRTGGALDRLAISTATALVALHDAGVVHRDFKPQNVLLGPDGPRVIDFGIARALAATGTVTTAVVGTPAYMAPEQFKGGELGLAVDVFSWAATMAFAATGRPPFGADSPAAIMNRVLNEPPDLGGVESPLRDLLAECLAKNPADRPSAHRILDRLVRRNGHAAAESGAPDIPPAAAPVAEVDAADRKASAGGATGPKDDTGARRRSRLLPVAAAAAAVTAGAAIVLANPSAFGLWPGGQERAAPAVPRSSGTAIPSPTGASPTGTGGSTGRGAGATAPGVPVESPRAASRGVATSRPIARPTGPGSTPTSGPSSKPSAGPTETPAGTPTSAPTPDETTPPTTSPPRPVELGPVRLTRYCRSLGWEWAEYRTWPQPGAYCVTRRGETMPLSPEQRDEACRRRYGEPKAFHRYRGRANWCYVHL